MKEPQNFFEKQNQSKKWVEYRNNKIRDEYSQISIAIDFHGYPIVILLRKDGLIIKKLTQGSSYWSSNMTGLIRDFSDHGFWLVKDGKVENFFSERRFFVFIYF